MDRTLLIKDGRIQYRISVISFQRTAAPNRIRRTARTVRCFLNALSLLPMN